MRSNTGKPFEHQMETVCTQYERRGLLRLKKVEPPSKIVGTGNFRKVIFLENPYLDFAGCWPEAKGRAVFCECKSTSEPRLRIQDSGGLTAKQVASLIAWHNAGAVTFVLWEHAGVVRFITTRQVADKLLAGVKHFKPEELDRVEQGTGFVTFDFLKNMRALWMANMSA